MTDAVHLPRVTMNLIRGCLVATIQIALNRRVLEQFRTDLLEEVARSGAKQVILDCSGIEVLDDEDFEALRRTIAMASLMGVKSVLAGLQPGVVSALVEWNVSLEGLHTVLSLDDAFRLLESGTPHPALARRGPSDQSPATPAEEANAHDPPQ
jgi:anti-anti-sigma regulatory factor